MVVRRVNRAAAHVVNIRAVEFGDVRVDGAVDEADRDPGAPIARVVNGVEGVVRVVLLFTCCNACGPGSRRGDYQGSYRECTGNSDAQGPSHQARHVTGHVSILAPHTTRRDQPFYH